MVCVDVKVSSKISCNEGFLVFVYMCKVMDLGQSVVYLFFVSYFLIFNYFKWA